LHLIFARYVAENCKCGKKSVKNAIFQKTAHRNSSRYVLALKLHRVIHKAIRHLIFKKKFASFAVFSSTMLQRRVENPLPVGGFLFRPL